MSMKSIYSQVEANKLKTFLLMFVFSAVVFAVAYFAYQYTASVWVIYISFFFALFMNIASFWFSDKLALSSVGAEEADPEQYRELHRIVENLAITAGITKPKVYIIHDNSLNAFATGRDPKHAAVAVTEGLLSVLDRSELEAVMAHELSHVKNRDILVSTVAVVLVGFLSLLVDYVLRFAFFFGSNNEERPNNPIFAILGFALMFFAPVIGQLIQLAVSRKREFLADSSGALLTRYPEALASALVKISKNPLVSGANTATAHLFIEEPFKANFGAASKIAKWFSTHPPTEERIMALLGEDKARVYIDKLRE